MENEKKEDQTAEIKDEELDQVSGGDGGCGGGCVICGRKDRPPLSPYVPLPLSPSYGILESTGFTGVCDVEPKP